MSLFKERRESEEKSFSQQQALYSEGFVIVVFALKELLDLEFFEDNENKRPKDKSSLLIKEIKKQKRAEKTKEQESKIKINEQKKDLALSPLKNSEIIKEIAKNKEMLLLTKEKIEKEKVALKEHEITDAYVFAIYNPLTKKAEVIKEQQIIKFDTLEQKIVDECLSQKNDEKMMIYIVEPMIKKDIESFIIELKYPFLLTNIRYKKW